MSQSDNTSVNNPGVQDDDSESVITVQMDALDNDKVRIGLFTDIGKRRNQQDAIKSDDDFIYNDSSRVIAILCDGMGGLSGGEIASNHCVNTLFTAFHTVQPKVEEVPMFYRSMVNTLDNDVVNLKDSEGNLLKAGTTLLSVCIVDDKLFWVSVGDSRIYIIRNNEIVQITEDHNFMKLLKEQVAQNLITLEQAEANPKKEALISFLGIGGVGYISMNIKPFDLLSGDSIVLCSDGLYRMVSEDEMVDIVNAYNLDASGAAEALVQCALDKNNAHQDNTSVIVLKFIDNG